MNNHETQASTCIAQGTINVQGPTFGRVFGRGSSVNLSEVAGKVPDGVGGEREVTWGECIGERYIHLFVPGHVDVPAADRPVPQADVEGEE